MKDTLTVTRAQFGDAVYAAVLNHSSSRVGGHLVPYGALAGDQGLIQYAWDSLSRRTE